MPIKLLLVEDEESDRDVFRQSVDVYSHEKKLKIDLVETTSLEEALNRLDGSFDGAVIDMKLGDKGGEGNQILHEIGERNLRVPIVILTGTPSDVTNESVHIEVLKKGEADNAKILEEFQLLHASGLTKVMGGRGLLEDCLNHVFKNNIVTQKETWKRYGKLDADRSEKALLRHVMSHLVAMIDLDEESCVPEEFYIYPPLTKLLRTGTILMSKKDGKYYAVMNPLCDLTRREHGDINARNIILCKVTTFEECCEQLPEKKRNSEGRSNLLKNLNSNNKFAYHRLPSTSYFDGGYLDFESVVSVDKASLAADFGDPVLQVSGAFMKDVSARFSSYFGRQGQPSVTYSE